MNVPAEMIDHVTSADPHEARLIANRIGTDAHGEALGVVFVANPLATLTLIDGIIYAATGKVHRPDADEREATDEEKAGWRAIAEALARAAQGALCP